MSQKGYRVSPEIKEQVISRIKNDGVSVLQAAKEHGVSTKSIYNWLGTQARGSVSLLEHNRVKKEDDQLKQLIGDMTLRLSKEQKRG